MTDHRELVGWLGPVIVQALQEGESMWSEDVLANHIAESIVKAIFPPEGKSHREIADKVILASTFLSEKFGRDVATITIDVVGAIDLLWEFADRAALGSKTQEGES